MKDAFYDVCAKKCLIPEVIYHLIPNHPTLFLIRTHFRTCIGILLGQSGPDLRYDGGAPRLHDCGASLFWKEQCVEGMCV
jgi:hypothetical protein